MIDVYGEEITVRVNNEAITCNLDQTSRYSSNYDDISVNQIDVIDITYEEYAQKILGFLNNSLSGNPSSTSEPIVSDSSPYLTPFEGSDFILEYTEAYLKNDSISPEIEETDFDPEGDILLLGKMLNNDPSPSHHPMELKIKELKEVNPSNKNPPEPELKDLPPHLEYAFLKGTKNFPSLFLKTLKMRRRPNS